MAERLLSAEDVARYPVPGANVPVNGAFSPDGAWFAYLWSADQSLRRDLFVLELTSGITRPLLGAATAGVTEENLTIEERLRRERARNLGQGVTSLAWAKGRNRLLVPQQDGLHVLDAPDFADVVAVSAGAAGAGPMIDPQLSFDGSAVAFVVDDEIFVAPLPAGAPIVQVTSGAGGTGRTHGLAEFVAQEEMGRFHGFWWSPDGRRLAFTEVDETHIPVYRIVHQGRDAVGQGAEEDHRYPFAGADNARVRLFVVDASGGDAVEMDLGSGWEYLARVDWLSPSVLCAQLQDREQTRLEVVALDPATGERRRLLTEESAVWINLHDALRPVGSRDDGRFLWASERTGFQHLEVRRISDGSAVDQLTQGEWIVQRVVSASATAVWFVATKDSPLERHLYEVPLAGGDVRRVTLEPGTHAIAAIDAAGGRFVDVWSSLTQPPVARVCSLADGSVERPLLPDGASADARLDELALQPPELTTVETADGVTLHALVYRPDSASFGAGPHPTVVWVYGGPHAQMVVDGWGPTAAMRAQWLRSLGFVVVVADNRGSAGRGLAFEGAVRWNLGAIEIDDQVAVVEELAGRGIVDPARVAMSGWSYGGYMSALCLAKRPDVFKAAVAGAPVTAWDGYDTHYTERYLGLPSANPEGYARSQVMAHVEGLRDRSLLLVHGLIDENVHFRHTARLVNALIKARIPYELLLFPDERHSPRSVADRVYMEERIRDFLLASV